MQAGKQYRCGVCDSSYINDVERIKRTVFRVKFISPQKKMKKKLLELKRSVSLHPPKSGEY